MRNSEHLNKSLRLRLQQLRSESGLSLRAAAGELNISAGYLSRIEGRGEVPSAELICCMAEIYSADPAELFELAKSEQLESTAKTIEQKQNDALRLYRKRRSASE